MRLFKTKMAVSAAASFIAAFAMIFVGFNTAQADHTVDPDLDNDGFISVIEGIPFYGGIVSSLTTEGDTSASSALALDRFPVADSDGKITYQRTFTLPESVNPDNLEGIHIVIHGIDIDNSGLYDGEKPTSLGIEGVPFEATVPAACGALTRNGKSDTYRAKISELNSTGVKGSAQVRVDGDQVTVRYTAQNLSPNIVHAQHFHMNTTGNSSCPVNTIGVDQE